MIAATHWVNVWVAGDAATAVRVCREYCSQVGLCVTVTPTDYVYRDGLEAGVVVRLINYPRFPKPPAEIDAAAAALGEVLRTALCQSSYCLESPTETVWVSHRAGDLHPGAA